MTETAADSDGADISANGDKAKPAIPEFGFRGIWRGYQQRLIDELAGHMDDRRLHVVAAPGAGKTLIGLEVVRRLERPALVLSPSLAIRDQWLQRLAGMFRSEREDWLAGVGHDLAAPGWLTSSTYQSVHAALSGVAVAETDEAAEADETEDEDDGELATAPEEAGDDGAGDGPVDGGLLRALSRAGVATLVLDEAHHLRKAWWDSLQVLVRHLRKTRKDFHIVSLTATPPYDVDAAEWERYEAVCGPIDAEISIPELVRQGDLCPHQDFVWFSFPKPVEIGAFETFARESQALVERWATRPELAAAVAGHPWLSAAKDVADDALSRPELLGALAIAAQANGQAVPPGVADLLGADAAAVPPPAPRNLTALLQAVLDGDLGVPLPDGLDKALAADLRAIGGLSRRKVRLNRDEPLARALTRSTARIEATVEIAHEEYDALGPALRMVVLTDSIRADALRRPDAESADGIGAGPILRRMIATELTDKVETALVTGSLVVVRAAVADAVLAAAARAGMRPDEIALRPLPALPDWLSVEVEDGRRGARLATMTRLLEAGTLRCLVGTAALLGEGWDAPSINSLVLATSVRSSMLSNQMRGRAIRRQPGNPDKTAAIWHLATIIPPDLLLARTADSAWDRFETPHEEIEAEGVLAAAPSRLGRDAQTIAQRFKVFSAVGHAPPFAVSNGIARLGIDETVWDAAAVARVNRLMLARAADRPAIAAAWRQSVGGAMRMQRPAEALRTRPPTGPRLVWNQGIAALFAPLLLWLLYVVQFTPDVADIVGETNAVLFGLVCVAGGIAWNGRRIGRLVTAGSPGRHLRQIGEAVLDGLAAAGVLHTPRERLAVVVGADGRRRICRVDGGTRHDEAAFVDALAELLDPLRNPRRILVRHARLWPTRRRDFHAVPAEIAASDAATEAFAKGWRRRVGVCTVLSTRGRDGRRRLLEARARQYAASFVPAADRLTVWE